MKARLINYFDVWGNKKDGWEVNNECEECIVDLPEDFKEDDILRVLKDIGFLKKHVRKNMLYFDYSFMDAIEILQKSDYMPVCRLDFYFN